MAVFKPQRKTSSGMEDLDIDAATLDGKDSSHYLNYNNLTNKPTVPTKTSQLTNDSGFKTTDTDTWRTISVNGATIFGGATNTAGMNLQKGNNVTIEATAGSPNVKISATNTTYTFANGTNSFTVTPKGGTAQTVTVTPSIANATTSKAGLMSSTDKTNLDTLSNLLGDDSDTVVNKINEVIEIFDSYPEGNKIVDALAGKQSKVAALGSTTKPVYVSAAGTFTAASTYAGGTKVTLNGTDKGASTATIYAPTAVGTSGQILKSNGSGAPTWVAQSTLSAGSATKATQDASGNVITSTYATKNETATARNIAAALNSAHVVNADGTLEAKYDGDGNEITATYAKKEYAVYYVAGNTTGTAGTWTGTNSDIKSLYDGLVINYKIGINGADPTTLNINGLGAKTVYLRGTTKVTTHYDVGTMVLLAYNATKGAFYSADYDANSYAYVRQYKTTTNANYPMLFAYDTTLPSSYDTKYTRKNSNITANPSTGTINATSFIENGKALSSKYLPLTGGTIDGNLTLIDNSDDSGTLTTPCIKLGYTDDIYGRWYYDEGIYVGAGDTAHLHPLGLTLNADDSSIELNGSNSNIFLQTGCGLVTNADRNAFGFDDAGYPTILNHDGRYLQIATDTLVGNYENYLFTEYSGYVPVTATQGTSGQVLTSNGNGTYKWSSVSGGGGNSSFNSAENITADLESQSPTEFDLDCDTYKELIVCTRTQDDIYELSDDFGNTVSCKEIAVMHLNYMSEDEMLIGTMTSDTGISKPFISSNLRFFAESRNSITLNVIIYGR